MTDNSDFLAGQKAMKSFKDVSSKDDAMPELHNMAEFINVQLVMESFELRQGSITKEGVTKQTEYAVISAMKDDLETIYIRCGGYIVMRQLAKINQANDLPLYFTPKLEKDGKTLYFD